MGDRIGPLICPVLVGRDDLLSHAARRLAGTRAGRGQLLLLAGEAGIGKSRLLSSIERLALKDGYRLAGGRTHPRDLEVPAAPFLDLARDMRRGSAQSAVGTGDQATLGGALEQRLTEPLPAEKGDTHRRRRLLVLDVVDVLTAAADQPMLLSLEDLHWADDLSLQILAALAGRLEGVPLIVVGTYRSDELYPRVPMREWRSRLVNSRLAEEARLGRLSLEDTGRMVGLLLASELPPPSELVTTVYERTDGIPLHVEELLGAVAARADAGAELVRGIGVPDTLELAIVDRLGRRSPDAVTVAQAGAVIGRSFRRQLLSELVGMQGADIGRALAELSEHFFVVPGEEDRHDFRHALIRDAIYGRIPAATRRALHSLVADAGAAELGPAEQSRHLEEAGRAAEAFAAAREAARAAARLSAHREALQLYRRALRQIPPGIAAAERAELLHEAGLEAAAADDNETAAQLLGAARTTYLAAGLGLEAATVLAPLVAARHLLGDGLDARSAALNEGLSELDALAPSPDVVRARARLQAGLAAAYMLDRRLGESIEHGQSALALAGEAADADTGLDVLATLGSDYVFAGRMEEGWRTFDRGIASAREGRREAQAARAYRMAGSCASVLVEYEIGERLLSEGIEYAERAELWNHRHYMAAHLAHVLWATGRWPEAELVARHALADGRGGMTTRITALHVLGYVGLGRGELDAAAAYLAEARELGEHMRELQRLSPALWGLAEIELQRGRPDQAMALCELGLAASAAVDDAAYLFPYLVTGTRALLGLRQSAAAERWIDELAGRLERRAIPGTLPAIDHARGLLFSAHRATGRARQALQRAEAGWSERSRTWEWIHALVDLAACQLRSHRAAEAIRSAEQARAAAHRMGSPQLVRRGTDMLRQARARHPLDEPWAPLSAREFAVARLVADGWTNREIATELVISPRTVGSHVEHILNKLGIARRTEIAAWAAIVDEHPPMSS